MHPIITPEIIKAGISFPEFRQVMQSLLAEGKSTGTNQSEFLTELSKSNLTRMDKAEALPLLPELVESLEQINRPLIWLIINEGWCTDAAHNVPLLANLAACSSQIELHIILRSEYPEVMDAYLTNGGRSIPKLICLDAESITELGTWGPRPANAQELAYKLKKEDKRPITEIIQKMDDWAEQDKGQSLQKEFLDLVSNWKQANKG